MYSRKYKTNNNNNAHPTQANNANHPNKLGPLEQLPLELFIETTRYMPLEKIEELAATSKKIHGYANSDALWWMLLERDFKQEFAEELENRSTLTPKQLYQLYYFESQKAIKDFCSIPTKAVGFLHQFSAFPLIGRSIKALEQWRNAPPAIRFATVRECKKHYKVLVSELVNRETHTVTGEVPLIEFSYEGLTNLVKILVKNGADVNAKTNDNMTALEAARVSNHIETAQFLAENGAKENVNPQKKNIKVKRKI